MVPAEKAVLPLISLKHEVNTNKDEERFCSMIFYPFGFNK